MNELKHPSSEAIREAQRQLTQSLFEKRTKSSNEDNFYKAELETDKQSLPAHRYKERQQALEAERERGFKSFEVVVMPQNKVRIIAKMPDNSRLRDGGEKMSSDEITYDEYGLPSYDDLLEKFFNKLGLFASIGRVVGFQIRCQRAVIESGEPVKVDYDLISQVDPFFKNIKEPVDDLPIQFTVTQHLMCKIPSCIIGDNEKVERYCLEQARAVINPNSPDFIPDAEVEIKVTKYDYIPPPKES